MKPESRTSPEVRVIGCFLIGAFWGAEGLAAAWLVAIPATCLLNFPFLIEVGLTGGSFVSSCRPGDPTLELGDGRGMSTRLPQAGVLSRP